LASDIFGTPPSITLPQVLARTALIFFYVLILLRIGGPRLFAKFSPIDMIGSVVIGSSLSRAMTGTTDLWGALVATALFVALRWLFNHAAATSESVSRLLEGKPVPLGENGQIRSEMLRARGISNIDFGSAVRDAGLSDAGEVQHATLEPNGRITIWPRR
jgi:uncharacterized membrane protein YcaP (DUF421 family)